MVWVSKLLEWSRMNSSLTIKGKKLFCKVCNYQLNFVQNHMQSRYKYILFNNLKKLTNIFK